ncbi:MAG: bacteriophage holin [Chlamydiales bacterium]
MLSIKGLCLGLGAAWSFCILICGWSAIFGWGNAFVEVMASIYVGYEASFLGGIIGAMWGFLDGLIFGLIFGSVYNLTATK